LQDSNNAQKLETCFLKIHLGITVYHKVALRRCTHIIFKDTNNCSVFSKAVKFRK